ncbi:MAG TPA: cobalamin-binding protein [Polyangiaceae bacterium]|nr:cobalamin-binding protein [Polyangiaceae bacterium]
MTFTVSRGPRRIVCLTEEPTEILYLLGAGERVVGISAYTVRPPEARRDKPVVSAFIGGSVQKIRALEPDLVIGFSDIQAELAKQLIQANLPVLIFNQRSLQEVLDVILALGRIVDRKAEAETLVAGYVQRLEALAEAAARRSARPRVYFEEWDEPMITAIRWVSELIEIAGGRNIFEARSRGKLAKERFVSAEEVLREDPEVVLASWCGKPFDRAAFEARPGFAGLSAVRRGRVHEVPSEIILQPGPACLTDGLQFLLDVLKE